MADLPADAIEAAVTANDAFFANDDDLKFSWQDGSDVRELARRMLEAAAPALRAQGAAAEREACAQLAEQHDAQVPTWREGQTITEVFLNPGGITTWHPFADLIRTRKEAAHGPHRDEQ